MEILHHSIIGGEVMTTGEAIPSPPLSKDKFDYPGSLQPEAERLTEQQRGFRKQGHICDWV